MDTELNPNPLEKLGTLNEIIFNFQSNKRPGENSDSEQDTKSKHPRKHKTGRNSTEAQLTKSKDPIVNRQASGLVQW